MDMVEAAATVLHDTATSDAPVSHRIIRKIAQTTGTGVSDLPQLYHAVDPEALDTLFGDGRIIDGALSFEYADHRVTVDADGAIDVSPL